MPAYDSLSCAETHDATGQGVTEVVIALPHACWDVVGVMVMLGGQVDSATSCLLEKCSIQPSSSSPAPNRSLASNTFYWARWAHQHTGHTGHANKLVPLLRSPPSTIDAVGVMVMHANKLVPLLRSPPPLLMQWGLWVCTPTNSCLSCAPPLQYP